jgi:MFS family permease
MLDRLRRLHPFQSPDARRLAVLFAMVYFAQGMWYLPNQTITITFKDQGLSAGQVATFFSITTVPWLVKPLYGLISDFVPLFGRRRKSYLILTSALAAACGMALAAGGHGYARLAAFVTAMGLGLAFTDVLVDALMVENGRPRGLTGAFQSVQWAAIYTSTIVVGLLGGWLAEHRRLALAFGIAALFPLLTLTLVTLFVHEAPAADERETVQQTWRAVRAALGDRDVWVVAGFILFFTFSPSFGPALLYYQTDRLGFSQQFIGLLGALSAAAAVVGAAIYAPLSRRVPLERLIRLAIVIAVVGTLAYLLYRGRASAVAIDVVFGCVGMITQLAFLDLAAKACPRGVEATFFALLMSVYNGGVQISQVTGGYLYDWVGYTPLVLISASLTAAALLLVPAVRIPRIESRAAQTAVA